jgi:hypothetical protein
MSILDDAIREHLELKRQHGAPDDEVKKLEDEAFGPPARPDDQEDPFAEAPTEFMEQPAEQPEGRPAPNIADLQEAPPALDPEPAPEPAPEAEFQVPDEPESPAEEEQPAAEHEAIADIADDSAASHTTQERHAIAEQPTEMFDVESEMAPAEPEAPAPASEPAPSDEELVESELEEPRFAAEPPLAEPPAPAPADPAPAFDEEDDFFDEQRLSDELDQALEAPLPPLEEEEEPVAEVTSPPAEPEATEEHAVLKPEEGHEDVLEDTPDFLEESPEDDQLWFEQKPPKDFDFDD